MATEEYTRSELLVDAAWVDAHKDDPNVVIVDCEVDAAFARGHIPGAVLVPDNYEKNPDTGRLHLMDPSQFKNMCEDLGIGDDTLVITYDHSRSLTAARLWWALNTYGHTNTKILNGGWRAWISHGGVVDFGRAEAAGRDRRSAKAQSGGDHRRQRVVGDCVLVDGEARSESARFHVGARRDRRVSASS